ncbi:MAG: SAM-dependent DNA methyltransferase [Clostridia bacterium]|nr:SAM-dependent DNA methyltransferase [Clostridia bacterium]
MGESQIKSKKRVTDHGEVYTNEREVKAMCDLVKSETERIDSRFLEPACGNGNFLAEILSRKLAVVNQKYKKSPYDYEKYSVVAITSLYGVDILIDNVMECRERLYNIWNKEYTKTCKKEANDECRKAVQYILSKNILCGNALSLMQVDEKGNDTDKPIAFAEWSLVSGNNVKRRDYYLNELLDGHKEQIDIFMTEWDYDEETQSFIPKPFKEYPLTDYRRLSEHE